MSTFVQKTAEFFLATFDAADANNAPVSISVPGIKAGDMLLKFVTPVDVYFENDTCFATVDDQLQQTWGNQAGLTLSVLVMRMTAV